MNAVEFSQKMKIHVCLSLTVTVLVFAGCVSVAPDATRTTVLKRKAIKPEVLESRRPLRVALVNRMPPVLYINNIEGNVWAGKSTWVESTRLHTTSAALDEAVMDRLRQKLGVVEVRRMELAEARAATDFDWIIVVYPNGMVIPDFTWGEFAKMVLRGSAAVVGGTPAPMALQQGSGAGTVTDVGENRPAYALGTHAMYGTFIIVATRWEAFEAKTWHSLGGLQVSSVIRLPKDLTGRRWEGLSLDDQNVVWNALDQHIRSVATEQMIRLGL